MKNYAYLITFLVLATYGPQINACLSKCAEANLKYDSLHCKKPDGWPTEKPYIKMFPWTLDRIIHLETMKHFDRKGIKQPDDTEYLVIEERFRKAFLNFNRVKIQQINSTVGLGVIATEDIPQGQLLCEYTGDIILPDPTRHYTHAASLGRSTPLAVDGQHRGNEASLINHSAHPNTDRKIYTLPSGKPYIMVIAIRNISAHEQITTDYGPDYWQAKGIIPDSNI